MQITRLLCICGGQREDKIKTSMGASYLERHLFTPLFVRARELQESDLKCRALYRMTKDSYVTLDEQLDLYKLQ